MVLVEAGDIVPCDGEVIEGIASVDESAITGESAPVIRESGGDRNVVTGGTRVLSDWLVIRVTAEPGAGFLDRMIQLIEGARRQKTPNEIALNILLAAFSIIFLVVCASLLPFSLYSVEAAGGGSPVTVTVLVALLVCLIPTTIGGLLSAIGIAGMDRMIRHNVIATSGRAIEAAGDIDVLLLDKTGTMTLGNRMATEFIPAPGIPVAASSMRRSSRHWRMRRPRAGRSSSWPKEVRPPRTGSARDLRPVRSIHRADPDERSRHPGRWRQPRTDNTQRGCRGDQGVCREPGRQLPGGCPAGRSGHQPHGRDSAGRRRRET